MRELTTYEIEQVSGAQDTWVFTGEPISVANIEQIQASFYSSVFDGAVGGAVAGAVRGGAAGVVAGSLAGAALGGAGWAYSVSMYTPMVTYTPVITITEIAPGSTPMGGDQNCY